MLVTTFDHKILAVNARFPGSVHDAAVWQLSTTRATLLTNFTSGRPIGILLADREYPCEPWLLTPIERETSASIQAYNRTLKAHRKEIEMAIGEIKNCWRALLRHRVLQYSPEVAGMVVYCCSTFHNFRKAYNVHLFESDSDSGSDSDSDEFENLSQEDIQPPSEDGHQRRHDANS